MFKDLQNNYSKILCFFVCILIIIKTICICHVSALVGDDILFTYLTVPFGADDETLNASSFDLMVNQFSNLLNEYNSGLVSHFLQKFFHMFLPIFLGIHPEDFVFIPLSIFKGIIFFCIIYLMSNFSQIQLKNKKIELSVLMFLSIIIFIFTKYNYPNIFNNGVNFYSYFYTLHN